MKTLSILALTTLAAATLGTAASACADLRVQTSVVPHNGIDHILVDVRNIGASPYVSGAGLQRVVLSVAGQPLHQVAFTSVGVGAGGVWHVPLPADDYANHVRAEIVYAASNATDVNPWNDDCVASNNSSMLRLPG